MTQLFSDRSQMLLRGIACIVIGAVVLLAPHFLQSAGYREMIGGARLVGWFALVLGIAMVVVDRVRHLRKR